MLLRHLPKFVGVAAVGVPLFVSNKFKVDHSKGSFRVQVPTFAMIQFPIVSHCESNQSNGNKGATTKATELHVTAMQVSKDKPSSGILKGLSLEDLAKGHYQLALCYARGVGVPQDIAKAMTYFKLAADQGHTEAQSKFGLFCYADIGIPKDCTLAERYLTLAAAQDDVEALRGLGVLNQLGNCGGRNIEAALYSFQRASDLGDYLAQFSLGSMLSDDAFPEESMKYFKMAADQGHPMSAYFFGKGLFRTGGDRDEAMRYLQFAVKHGVGYVQAAVGAMLWEGYAEEQDKEEGLRLLKLSAEQGCVMARRLLANINSGHGLSGDPSAGEYQLDDDEKAMIQAMQENPDFWELYKW